MPGSGSVILSLQGVGLLVAASVWAAPAPAPAKGEPGDVNYRAAAAYLDARQDAWQAWDPTWQDHGTYCVSCHTQATYGAARSVLRARLGDPVGTAEAKMLASLEKRVHTFARTKPFYSDLPHGPGKEVQSHNAEAVLNAYILLSYDTAKGQVSDIAREAVRNAFALQLTTGPEAGSWVWLDFHLRPWEDDTAGYYWAAQLAGALSRAPGGFGASAEVQPHLAALEQYLRSRFASESLINQISALMAVGRTADLLDPGQVRGASAHLMSLQRADGGWSLSTLVDRRRTDGSLIPDQSDAYATAVAVLALRALPADKLRNDSVAAGQRWLARNQDRASGRWLAWSANRTHDPASITGQFMNDAATAYAILALN